MSVEVSYRLSVSDSERHFSQQWEAHRKDLTGGHWTNMTLVGVSADGTSSSVKVNLQEKGNLFFEILSMSCMSCHAII